MRTILAVLALTLFPVSVPAQDAPIPEGVKVLDADGVKELLAGGKALLVNTLSPLEFTQTKISGSVNLSYEHLRDGEDALPADKETALVFYCLGPKWTKSPKAAGLAVAQGYRNVSVYPGGFPDWKQRGNPVEEMRGFLPQVEIPAVGPAELKGMLDAGEKLVLLGISDREDIAKAGQIRGTVRIPLVDLMARHGEVAKDARIVVVDLAGQQTPIAGRYLVKQGYAKVSRLDGGVRAWAAAGHPVVKP